MNECFNNFVNMNHDEREMLLQKIAEAERKVQRANKEREAAEKKLKEYEEMTIKAEKASHMKSLFLANMSHEIRTPLNAIEGFARIIAETDSQDERMRFLEIIESSNNRLSSLINEILDLSRVEAGEIAIRKAETDLYLLCKDIKQLFKFKCPEQVRIKVDTPAFAITLNTDANRLTQVFSNLINNALKHTRSGSVTFGYRLVNDRQDIEFYVKDTGTGIAPEDISRIFQTYVSKDAETLNNGYGLGLPLCKIIVEKLGGTISVESEIGKGSTFTFTLPFEGKIGGEEKRISVTTTSRTLRMDAHGGKNRMRQILIAEDEDSNYELLKNVLAKRYRLLRARNGIEAVTLNEEEKPDLILMDIRMPDMNGLDATRIIKEVSCNTPIIVLSAYAFDDNIRDAKTAGCDEFIAKPLQIEELTDTIKKYLKE